MVGWYRDDLLRILDTRYPPARVHSIVIMTKFAPLVLEPPLSRVLRTYDQVVVQATVTGLGATRLEPRVPRPETCLAALPGVVELTGDPARVALRFDPLVWWRERDSQETMSNLPLFRETAAAARAAGIRTVKASIVTPYAKASRRFARHGLVLDSPVGRAREEALEALERVATETGMTLEYCCEPGRQRSACVDAARLSRLHPLRLPVPGGRPAGQRERCGCARAVDVAWYSAHPCPSGCLYCYANPAAPEAGS